MNAEKMNSEKIKPLGRSIVLGCIFFIITLCLVLGLSSHLNYKRSLYEGYNSYIIDILNYVETSINAEENNTAELKTNNENTVEIVENTDYSYDNNLSQNPQDIKQDKGAKDEE